MQLWGGEAASLNSKLYDTLGPVKPPGRIRVRVINLEGRYSRLSSVRSAF